MKEFTDREDVEEWLAQLDYEGFWKEAARFELDITSRTSCDIHIATGAIDEETVLFALKGMARLELVDRYDLRPRAAQPWHRIH